MTLIAVVVASVFYVAGTRSDAIAAQLGFASKEQIDFSSLQSVYDVLASKYAGELDPMMLLDGAKKGLVNAAGDPYTTYFNAEEAQEFNDSLDGTFEGIGAELGKRDDRLVIIAPLDDSPAEKAGLRANDIIVSVNDEDATGWSVEEAVTNIRGEKGTTVKLGIIRGDESMQEISVTRDTINNPSVTSEIKDGIGIMRISRFGEGETTRLARAAAEEFKRTNVKGVIVDLRGNGGGYLNTSVDIASIWLDDKVVVTERRDGKVIETFGSDNDPILGGVPTIVLVNGGSASASEILAGALRDNGAATLLGEQTFGKGSVQSIEPLPGGAQLKVTVARWFTPDGKNISEEGITPDIKVELDQEDFEADRDPQHDRALRELR